ncbi:tetratricopeptide repeat protein [Phyllobacterium sp. YR531]|uniref:tetratricopeptide repeat protein n=1 Tax=Phyllobacterium sp. YR531 TaxID=1144343 RepID=UPI00026F8F81|nr:tetratricopeptide repeat protein [Phyllobacterium sp. YR531]EJN06074.1 tetratricopeptide repeat protein [Phyllobacterium sp. YR531]
MIKLPFSERTRRMAVQLAAVTDNANSPRSISLQADAARDKGNWADAAELYTKAIAADPARTGLLVQLGHAEKELGNYDRAETAYRKFVGMNPQNADVHLQLGHLFSRMGDSQKAREWYEKGLKLAPTDVELIRHANMARNRSGKPGVEQKRREAMKFVDAQDWSRARHLLRELVTEDNERDMIAVYANITKEDGDFDEAKKLYGEYREYAEAFDQNSLEDVELQLGHLHKLAGDYKTALSHYILARNVKAQRSGYIDQTGAIENEIQACVSEIYTCFAPPS